MDLNIRRKKRRDIAELPLFRYEQLEVRCPYDHELYRQNDISVGRRLLTIHGRRSQGLISCSLEHTFVPIRDENKPKYHALSYCWGPESPKKPILLNGAIFYVRSNLYSFLKQISSGSFNQALGPRTCKIDDYRFWIDQICINQNNLEEKGRQVSAMNRVFLDAESVLVWLGVHEENSRLACKALVDHDSFLAKLTGLPLLRSKVSQSIETLLKRDYWSRLWVIQEVVLAKKLHVLCGNDHFPWDKLIDMIDNFSHYSDFSWDSVLHSPAKTLVATQARLAWNTLSNSERSPVLREINIMEALQRFSGHQCQDPRDKVYGLLGILEEGQCYNVLEMKDEIDMYLRAEYTKSVVDVFVEACNQVFIYRLHRNDFAVSAQDADLLATLAVEMGLITEETCKARFVWHMRQVRVAEKAYIEGYEDYFLLKFLHPCRLFHKEWKTHQQTMYRVSLRTAVVEALDFCKNAEPIPTFFRPSPYSERLLSLAKSQAD